MEMFVFSLLLTVLCVGLYGKSTYAACTNPVVSLASLLVKYGDPAEVNCSIPNKPGNEYKLGWESKTSQPSTDTKTSVVWKVESLTKWEEAEGLQCYFSESNQCVSYVNLTIYKTPDRVTLSSVPGVWVEGAQTELRCEIDNVGPGRNLSVSWSRADPKQNNTFIKFNETFLGLVNETKNVSKTVKLPITALREDDGVQYQCAAVLNLERRFENLSTPLTITVHYKPIITQHDYQVQLVPGERLVINCSADGNPSPYYNWTLPNNTIISNSSITISSVHDEDQGQYTCIASNYVGQATQNVTVILIRDDTKWIIITIVVCTLVIVLIILFFIRLCYRRKYMSQYILKHLRTNRNKGHVEHNTEEQGAL